MPIEGQSRVKPSLYFMAVVPATSAAMAPASSPYAYPMCTTVPNVTYGRTYHRPASGALRCADKTNGPADRADDSTETQWRRMQGGAVARTGAHLTVGGPSTGARRDRAAAGTADGPHRPSRG
ncbi:hypothetical protein GCM10010264_25070 [Streptomyces globisporus]|nr:hypothetical protein GCM10010264_25070 [Streptomyces globisporus]